MLGDCHDNDGRRAEFWRFGGDEVLTRGIRVSCTTICVFLLVALADSFDRAGFFPGKKANSKRVAQKLVVPSQ